MFNKEEMLNKKGKKILSDIALGPIRINSRYLFDKRMWKDGNLFLPNGIVVEEDMTPNFCHHNSLNFYLEKKENIKVCSGYAYNDGSWEKHSWCCDDNNIIYECTPIKRKLYFGIILTDDEIIDLAKVCFNRDITDIVKENNINNYKR